jgi:hypothetical protein
LPLYEEAYSYGLNEKPNYNKMRHMLRVELLKVHCLPDKVFSFLQPSIKFYGFIILQNLDAEEAISDDDMVDEEIEVGYVPGEPLGKDNAKIMKEASGKTKN